MTTRQTANWLTRPSRPETPWLVLTVTTFLLTGAALHFSGNYGDLGLAASPAAVFGRGEHWRAWTALFAHADAGHLMSNLLLFIPLSFFLGSHFGFLFFPVLAFLGTGLLNFVVLRTLPSETALLGASGVVYWMGAAWLTLYFLLDRRDRPRRRFGHVLFLVLVLFIPETIKPEVSELSHFLGFVGGFFAALAYYAWRKNEFRAAERWEEIPEPPFFTEQVTDQASKDIFCLEVATISGESCQKISAEVQVSDPMQTKVE